MKILGIGVMTDGYDERGLSNSGPKIDWRAKDLGNLTADNKAFNAQMAKYHSQTF